MEIEKADFVKRIDASGSHVGLSVLYFSGYKESVACGFYYFFAEDKLVMGMYDFIVSETEDVKFYEKLVSELTSVYGKREGKYRGKGPFREALEGVPGLSGGSTALKSFWYTENSEIGLILVCYGDRKSVLALIYKTTIKELVELREKVESNAKKVKW